LFGERGKGGKKGLRGERRAAPVTVTLGKPGVKKAGGEVCWKKGGRLTERKGTNDG